MEMSIFIAGEGKSSGFTFNVEKSNIQSFLNRYGYLSISKEALYECKKHKIRTIRFRCVNTKDKWLISRKDFERLCYEDSFGKLAVDSQHWEWQFHHGTAVEELYREFTK